MRKIVIIIGFILCNLSHELSAQNSYEGIYLSSGDFAHGKLSYVNNQRDKNYKINLHADFSTSTIEIIFGDSTFTVNKKSIFGFRDKSGFCYRFYNNEIFKIINPAEEILLYSTFTSVGAPKNVHSETKYFFSKNLNSSIYSLTKSNVKDVFLNDVSFNKLLDLYFHSDSELSATNSAETITELNQVYKFSKQVKLTSNK